jgi:hypothetical protein
MKTNMLKILLVGGLLAFGLVSCSESNGENKDVSEMSIKVDSAKIERVTPKGISLRADISVDYSSYVSAIDSRYFQNDGYLKEMKKIRKSEVNAIQLKFDQELYRLNKRNLEIKTKVKNHKQQDPESWSDFKTATNSEMDALEKSIREFSDRVS